MGGPKQNYIITYATVSVPESIYLTFGNGKYAKQIFKALGTYYKSIGYDVELDVKQGYCMLTKKGTDGKADPSQTILYKLYQKQLMWRGQLPADIAFLEDYIEETDHQEENERKKA